MDKTKQYARFGDIIIAFYKEKNGKTVIQEGNLFLRKSSISTFLYRSSVLAFPPPPSLSHYQHIILSQVERLLILILGQSLADCLYLGIWELKSAVHHIFQELSNNNRARAPTPDFFIKLSTHYSVTGKPTVKFDTYNWFSLCD